MKKQTDKVREQKLDKKNRKEIEKEKAKRMTYSDVK